MPEVSTAAAPPIINKGWVSTGTGALGRVTGRGKTRVSGGGPEPPMRGGDLD